MTVWIQQTLGRHAIRKCRAQIQPALPLLRPFTQSLTVGHQNIRPQSSISMLQGWTGLFLWTAQKNAKLERSQQQICRVSGQEKKSCDPESQKQKRPCHPVWPSDYFSSCYHPSIVLYKKQFIMFHISYFLDEIRQDVSDPDLLIYFRSTLFWSIASFS